MRQLYALAIGVALIAAIACANAGGNDALLEAAAQCLHDKGLAQLAGHTTVAETVASMKAEVESGETTIKEIQQGYALLCKG